MRCITPPRDTKTSPIVPTGQPEIETFILKYSTVVCVESSVRRNERYKSLNKKGRERKKRIMEESEPTSEAHFSCELDGVAKWDGSRFLVNEKPGRI